MCGITGILHRTLPADDRTMGSVELMNNCLAHRGPDADGLFTHDRVCLGHRRLAIIDLDPRSNQPFTDVSGRYTLVFNGQIYNYLEVKAALPEYPFKTTSDTEVIVAAFAKWREKCLDKFNGMFALAIYDAVEKVVFVARDRCGVKPLYYSECDGGVVFASEVRAILASGMVSPRLSPRGLHEYFMFQASVCPNSILDGVQQLNPGHYGYISQGKVVQTRYWSPGESFAGEIENETQAIARVRELFLSSVEHRLVSDVPLGAFLSGGIDSSAVVAAMAEVSDNVNTFSITFDERDYDESPYSELIARMYKTNHHAIMLKPSDLLDDLTHALDSMDSPSVDGINSYIISKATKNAGITVALSGLGGDEVFAGYHYFKLWRTLKRFHVFSFPTFMRILATRWYRRNGNPAHDIRMRNLAQSDGSLEEVYPIFRQMNSQAVADALTKTYYPDQADTLTAQLSSLDKERYSLLSQFSIAELSGYTMNVLLRDTDQFSMASALEVREPFFDYRLVDYVLHVPDKWKLSNTPKHLLVKAMGDLLPKEIVYRPKRGFLLPWEYWLKHELKSFALTNIEYLSSQPEFNPIAVQATWDDFCADRNGVSWAHVWQLVSLSHWLKRNL